MSELDTILDLLWAFGDHRHRSQPATTFQSLHSWSAASSTPPGRPGDIDIGRVDGLIDRLRAQLASRLVREPLPQLVGDLLRSPPLAEETNDHSP